jgi:ElaB/YqjD/DUF883 family membrane-anchored ribosome-binding protein
MTRTAEAMADRTSDALASEMESLIQSASDLLESLNDQRGDAVEALRSRATRNIESARRRMAALEPQVREGATQAARAAAGFARRNPWSTVAIGTVILASVAMLLYASMSED